MSRADSVRTLAITLVSLASLSVRAPQAAAATRQVCASGCAYVSIQDAVDAAGSGDTIMILDPIHTEGGIVVGTDLTLAGDPAHRPILQAAAGPGLAVDRVLEIGPFADVSVRDLVIRHGHPTAGGGGGVLNAGELRLVRTDVQYNDAGGWHGGGILSTGSLDLVDSVVVANVAALKGGGISCEQPCSISALRTTVDANLLDVSDPTSFGGGGLFLSGTGRLESSHVGDNLCSGSTDDGAGGGIAVSVGELVLIDTDVVANQAGKGGGIYSNGPLTVVRGSISDNVATHVIGAAGGIASGGEPTLLESTVVSGNTGSEGGGVRATGQSFTIRRTAIVDNHASRFGGGLTTTIGGPTIVEDSLVAGNTSPQGGGISVTPFTEVRVRNSTISGNTSDEKGGGLWVGVSGVLQLSNVTVTDNTASPAGLTGIDGGGIFVVDDGSQHGDVEVRSSIIAGNHDFSPVIFAQAPDCAGPITVDGWLSLGGTGLSGLDPACIVSGATPDIGGDQGLLPLADNGGPTMTHALGAGSPNVDTGDPSGCKDAAGDLIPADQRGGPRVASCDRGAFEYGAAVPLFADGFESGELWSWSATVD